LEAIEIMEKKKSMNQREKDEQIQEMINKAMEESEKLKRDAPQPPSDIQTNFQQYFIIGIFFLLSIISMFFSNNKTKEQI
jgi:hypothetical protein